VADVHYFCSAWGNAKYFTVHTYSSSKKEFQEILNYESDSEIYRVRSVMIKNKRCVVYGGMTYTGVYNTDDNAEITHVKTERGHCAGLSLIGFNTTDFLILCYADQYLEVFSYTDKEKKLFLRYQIKGLIFFSPNNSTALTRQ